MSYRQNELLKLVGGLLDQVKTHAVAYEEDIALFRRALSFQPGDIAIVQTGDTCPCCNELRVRVKRAFVDEDECPAIEAEFIGLVDRTVRECGKDDHDTCVFAPDHLIKEACQQP